MLKNYFKTAFRNLLRKRGYALINIFGLATAIAACMLIFLVVSYEKSYDTFQPDFKSIYHIYTKTNNSGEEFYTSGIPFPALAALRTDIPQVKIGSLYATYGSQVTVLDKQNNPDPSKKFIEDMGLYYCDPQFFEVFSYKWLSGNEKVLAEPNVIVLTKSTATRFFGDWQSAVGRWVLINNLYTMKVAGILEDTPDNSDFQFTMIGSAKTMASFPDHEDRLDWGNTTSNFQLFTRLPPGVSEESISKQLQQLAVKYYKNTGPSKRVNMLQPLSDIHFNQDLSALGTHSTSYSTLYTLSFIALMIIVMACINFVNLSTAQAVTRSKEIGIRKVLGGSRTQLFWQMIIETKVVVLISALLAVGIALLALPHLKHVASIPENLSLFTSYNIAFLLICMIVVTFLAGAYPAMILSGFKPVQAIKNKVTSATVGGISLRRALVVLQFAISQVLIISTIVAMQQMDFIRTADLGFNKDAVLVVQSPTDSTVLSRQSAFKEELLRLPGVQSVSYSSDMPSSFGNWGTNFAYDHKDDENFTLYLKIADDDYFKTYGLEFLAGRPYSKSDSMKELVINEMLLKKLNIKNPQDAIGKELRTGGNAWKPIVGVVKDFKNNSLRDEVKPTMISQGKHNYGVVSVKLHSSNLENTRASIQKLWDKTFPEYVFSSKYMEETINEFYYQENQLALMYKIFAGWAIFISCLGLYGLVSFMALQKTKEVGIRKVLGASVGSIVYLFSREFTLLIGIAFVIAAPLAWYFMNKWLSDFVFHVHIGVSVFIIALLLSVVIAWISVGYKALRAAIANPVKSLKSE